MNLCTQPAVVDVLLQDVPASAALVIAAHQADRVDVEQQHRSTPLGSGLDVKDVRLAVRNVKRLAARGVLVQQVPQIGGRLMGGADAQKHRLSRLLLIACDLRYTCCTR